MLTIALTIGLGTIASAEVSKTVLDSIPTPDRVETSIGTLEYLDGAPSKETAQKVYDFLDTMRGVDTFLKGMPGAFNDAWFRYVEDIGTAGPDKGKGGQYLFRNESPPLEKGDEGGFELFPVLSLREGQLPFG